MKPKIFNEITCKKYAHGKGTVNVTKKGRVTFNKRALEILDLKKDQRINFVQDEENPSDWYIEKTTSKDGFKIIKNGNGYCLHSAGLAANILRTTEVGTSCKFILSHKIVYSKYHAIITHSKV